MMGSISQMVIFSMLGYRVKRARGNTARTDPQDRLRLRVQQGGQMPDHPLQFHVKGVVVASTWPFTQISTDPSFHGVIATEEFLPSAV